MHWQDFAVELFHTLDADPLYGALAHAELSEAQKLRYMVGWVAYYNPGVAAKASEYTDRRFWSYLFQQYGTAKRASERRHFRGAAGLTALRTWERMFPQPEQLALYMRGATYFEVRHKAQTVPQFGTYFTWKWGDVQERVFRAPCDFTGAEKYSPKVPQEGAKLIDTKNDIARIYARIAAHLNAVLPRGAPPWYDRPYNMQEAETVCCVYHQYKGGGYWPGSRTAKAILRLHATPCDASHALLDAFQQHCPQLRNVRDSHAWATQLMEKEPVHA